MCSYSIYTVLPLSRSTMCINAFPIDTLIISSSFPLWSGGSGYCEKNQGSSIFFFYWHHPVIRLQHEYFAFIHHIFRFTILCFIWSIRFPLLFFSFSFKALKIRSSVPKHILKVTILFWDSSIPFGAFLRLAPFFSLQFLLCVFPKQLACVGAYLSFCSATYEPRSSYFFS